MAPEGIFRKPSDPGQQLMDASVGIGNEALLPRHCPDRRAGAHGAR